MTTSAIQPILLKQREAAQLLSVSRATLYRMMKAGQVRPVTVRGLRRYRRADLEAIARNGA